MGGEISKRLEEQADLVRSVKMESTKEEEVRVGKKEISSILKQIKNLKRCCGRFTNSC